MVSRLVVAIALVALVGAGALALTAIPDESGASARYAVEIRGPEGALFSGDVEVADATALRALLAAADAASLDVETAEYPGMGTYVVAIGGHKARGADGWVYEVQRDGAWISGDRSAASFALREGDALLWKWTA